MPFSTSVAVCVCAYSKGDGDGRPRVYAIVRNEHNSAVESAWLGLAYLAIFWGALFHHRKSIFSSHKIELSDHPLLYIVPATLHARREPETQHPSGACDTLVDLPLRFLCACAAAEHTRRGATRTPLLWRMMCDLLVAALLFSFRFWVDAVG